LELRHFGFQKQIELPAEERLLQLFQLQKLTFRGRGGDARKIGL
jgi:hypothetical protein